MAFYIVASDRKLLMMGGLVCHVVQDGDSDVNHRGDIHNRENIPPEARVEIERLLHEGKKIEAIKVYRSYADATLKEAKEAVESVASGMGIKLTTGCLPALLFLTLTLLFIVWIGFVVSMPLWRSLL